MHIPVIIILYFRELQLLLLSRIDHVRAVISVCTVLCVCAIFFIFIYVNYILSFILHFAGRLHRGRRQ